MNKILAYLSSVLFCIFTVSASAGESIVGSWGYTYKDSQCREIYTFKEDGTYQTNSSEEVIIGKYKVEPVSGMPNRQKLTFYESHDNGLIDCDNKIVKKDLSGFLFFEIHGEKMTYYAKPDLTWNIIELEKIK